MPPVPLNGGAMCFPDLSYQGHDSMDHQLVRHQGGQSLHDQRQPGGEHPTRLGRPRITVPINPNDACRPATGRPANLIVSAREFTDAALKDSLPLASAALDRCFVEATNRRNEDSSYVAPAHTFLTPVEHVWGTKFWRPNLETPKGASELVFYSGRDRRRSGDLTLFRRALYLLSYPTG
jgi:hypothetical protein